MSLVRFDGQAAIVTGAGRGLGRAFALDLAKRGARVVVNGRPSEQGGSGHVEATVADIQAAGGTATPCYASVETPEGGKAIVERCLKEFGRVDVLVNNAGFLCNGDFEELSRSDIDAVLRVHLLGTFHLAQPAFRAMRARRYGRIVNISSTTGLVGIAGLANYAAAKGAVLALTRAMAVEGATAGILTNALIPSAAGKMQAQSTIPGFKDTYGSMREKLWPRMDPSTVAPIATYLASIQCRANGAAFVACAGRFARVGLSLGRGWIAPDAAAATAEDIVANIEAIDDLSDAWEPKSLTDIYQDIIQRLPSDGSRFR